MDKNSLLKHIAQTAYNVGFGAKKHFATFDIIEKAPGWIGFLSLVVAIYGLFIPPLTNNQVSAILIVFGIASLYISMYLPEKPKYQQGGETLTRVFHSLRTLYAEVNSANSTTDLTPLLARHEVLQSEGLAVSMSKQIFLSDWYAHYKFFWQAQVDWIDEQLHFSLWRDKLPLTVYVAAGFAAFAAAYFWGPALLTLSFCK